MGALPYYEHKEEQLYDEGDILYDSSTRSYFMIVDVSNQLYDVLILQTPSQYYTSVEKYSFFMANKYCTKV